MGSDDWEESAIRLVAARRRQTRLGVVAVETVPLTVVVIFVGWKHGILAGSNGMRNGIVLAAAAQPSHGAVAYSTEAIVAVRAVERARSGICPEKEQARENKG